MSETDRLAQYLKSAGEGAAFSVARDNGLVLIEPLTAPARTWLLAHTDGEASWNEGALAVESRYFPAIAEAIIDAGFTFLRHAPPETKRRARII